MIGVKVDIVVKLYGEDIYEFYVKVKEVVCFVE